VRGVRQPGAHRCAEPLATDVTDAPARTPVRLRTPLTTTPYDDGDDDMPASGSSFTQIVGMLLLIALVPYSWQFIVRYP
jgi:hypothetical protein